MQSKIIDYFLQISKVPRESKKEEQIRNFLISWAILKEFEYKTDKIWNLVVYIPATIDKKNSETIILQSHIDIVCIKDSWIIHNFEIDSIDVYEEDWFLKAHWTTLWADDWIWMAISLACAELESHPALELLFTVDEEQWLWWVSHFDASLVKWRKIINLDNEDEHEICVSSAGWEWIEFLKKNIFSKKPTFDQYKIVINWFKWWHSWVDIEKNRWNAIKFMFDFLKSLKEIYPNDFEFVSLRWWQAGNAIPKECELIIWIKEIFPIKEILEKLVENTRTNYDCPKINYKIIKNIERFPVISTRLNTNYDFIDMFDDIKIWVYKMSKNILWLTETSVNLWVINAGSDWINILFMPRSSISESLCDIEKDLTEKWKKYWFEIILHEKFFGWQQDQESDFVKQIFEEYKKVYWDKAKVVAVHAGLECWILVSRIWKWTEAVSIWPTISNPHSPDEKCEINSIWNVFEILKSFLSKFI